MRIGAMNHPGRPVESEIKWMSEVGLDFIDLTLEPPCADASRIEADHLRDLLQSARLPVVGHTAYYLPIAHPFPSIVRACFDEFVVCADIFQRLGASFMNIHPDGHVPMTDRAYMVRRNVEFMARLIEYAEPRGISIMVENVPGPFNTVEQLAELLNPLPKLGLHLDIGHAAINAPPRNGERIIETFGSRIRHVHLHDNKNNADLHLPLGAGTINWRAAVRALKANGYDDTITLEVFSEDRSYFTYSQKQLREYWDLP